MEGYLGKEKASEVVEQEEEVELEQWVNCIDGHHM